MLKSKSMRLPKTRINLAILILGFVIICLSPAILFKRQSISASSNSAPVQSVSGSEHYITIFDNNQKLTVKSDVATVADALARVGIQITEYDTVEPSLDAEIAEDDFNINIYRAREVVVVDGYSKKYIKTAKTVPEDVVEDAGVELLDADLVQIVAQNNLLESGMNVAYQVVRAKVVNLSFYGQPTQIRTQATTVADFLAEQNIDTDISINWISLELDQELTDGISFAVYRQGKQTISVEEDIAFGESVTYDYSVAYGTRAVTKAGKVGKRIATYEVDMKDGQELSRTFISNVITVNPETQYVTIGMKIDLPPGSHEDWMAAVGISPSDYGYVNYIMERESHWNPLAKNRTSGATGICQALPGSKMASAGADWETNPITQLRWCNGYAIGRYGSWAKAYEFWTQHHWW